MPKAYTLVELLVVVAVAPLLMVLVSGFFRSFLRDIPQAAQLLDQNAAVLDLLEQLRRDTDRATALPSQAGDRRADDATLLIEQADVVVCYRREEGRIVRTLLDRQGGFTPDGDRVWLAKNAVIEWRLWMREGHACAVEVHSHLKQQVAGQLRRRFLSSHVFFVGGLASGGASNE
jgi:prepilin-type N-terminal cleavage/methylation domain-containing protein